MLSLTRRSGEEIVVIDTDTGEHITFIVRLQGAQIRVGVQASPRFDIFRREVLERQSTLAAD